MSPLIGICKDFNEISHEQAIQAAISALSSVNLS